MGVAYTSYGVGGGVYIQWTYTSKGPSLFKKLSAIKVNYFVRHREENKTLTFYIIYCMLKKKSVKKKTDIPSNGYNSKKKKKKKKKKKLKPNHPIFKPYNKVLYLRMKH